MLKQYFAEHLSFTSQVELQKIAGAFVGRTLGELGSGLRVPAQGSEDGIEAKSLESAFKLVQDI